MAKVSDLPDQSPATVEAFKDILGIHGIQSGVKSYATVGDLPASPDEGTPAYVTDDPVQENNGLWSYTSGSWDGPYEWAKGPKGDTGDVTPEAIAARDAAVGAADAASQSAEFAGNIFALDVAVPYASGLNVDSTRFTVIRDGQVYAPTAPVPFTTAAWNASQWRLIQGITSFDLTVIVGVAKANVASVLADSQMNYTATPAGTAVRTKAEGYLYEVAPVGASDHHITTAGGVKLYVMPINGVEYHAEAFGVVTNGAGDQAAQANKWLAAAAGKVATWRGTIRTATRLDLVGSQANGTTIRGIGRGSVIKPVWQGPSVLPDVLRVQDCDGVTLEGFHIDGSEWLAAVPFNSRTGNQWARINPRNVTNLTVRGISGYCVGNLLQMNDVVGFTISDVSADDATLLVHMLGTTRNGVISQLRGTRIAESPVDWGGGGGQNVTVSDMVASMVGAWRQDGEGLDIGSGWDINISDCIFIGFYQGINVKGEDGTWGGISIDNCQFLDCIRWAGSVTIGNQTGADPNDFGDVKITRCKFTQQDSPPDSTEVISTSRGFLRIAAGASIQFKDNYVHSKDPLFHAILLSQSPSSVSIEDNEIVSAGMGVGINDTSLEAPSLLRKIKNNRITTEAGIGVRAGITERLIIEDNHVVTAGTGGYFGVEALEAKSYSIRRNTIENAGGAALTVTIRVSRTLAGVEQVFLPAPRFLRLAVENNKFINWGQNSTFRGAVILNFITPGTDPFYGGRIQDNEAGVDAAAVNSQYLLTTSALADGQLKGWWFAGNTSTHGTAAVTNNVFDAATCKIDNLTGLG